MAQLPAEEEPKMSLAQVAEDDFGDQPIVQVLHLAENEAEEGDDEDAQKFAEDEDHDEWQELEEEDKESIDEFDAKYKEAIGDIDSGTE